MFLFVWFFVRTQPDFAPPALGCGPVRISGYYMRSLAANLALSISSEASPLLKLATPVSGEASL